MDYGDHGISSAHHPTPPGIMAFPWPLPPRVPLGGSKAQLVCLLPTSNLDPQEMALHSSDSDHLGQALGVQQAFPTSRLCPFPLLALALSRGSGLDFASWPGTCLCVCFSATLGCFPASDGKVLTASHPTVIGSVPQAWRLSCHVQHCLGTVTTENSFIYSKKAVDGQE